MTRVELDTCRCAFEMTFTFDDETFYEESISKVIRVCDKHSLVSQDSLECAKKALLDNRLKNNPSWTEPESDPESNFG